MGSTVELHVCSQLEVDVVGTLADVVPDRRCSAVEQGNTLVLFLVLGLPEDFDSKCHSCVRYKNEKILYKHAEVSFITNKNSTG